METTYQFTKHTHKEIINALENARIERNLSFYQMSKKIGYSSTMYRKCYDGLSRFSRLSFLRFAQVYAPQLIDNTVDKDVELSEQQCIKYLKSLGYKIMKPVTEFVEL